MNPKAYVVEMDKPGAVLILPGNNGPKILFLGDSYDWEDTTAIPGALDASRLMRLRFDSEREAVEALIDGEWAHYFPAGIVPAIYDAMPNRGEEVA